MPETISLHSLSSQVFQLMYPLSQLLSLAQTAVADIFICLYIFGQTTIWLAVGALGEFQGRRNKCKPYTSFSDLPDMLKQRTVILKNKVCSLSSNKDAYEERELCLQVYHGTVKGRNIFLIFVFWFFFLIKNSPDYKL